MGRLSDFIARFQGQPKDTSIPLESVGNSDYKDYIQQMQTEQKPEYIQKGYNLKDISVTDPVFKMGTIDINANTEGYVRRKKGRAPSDVNDVLEAYSNNPIVASIVNTRVNQVTNYAMQADTTQDHTGWKVFVKGSKKPTPAQRRVIAKCEHFIENMGFGYDPTRDTFPDFLRKLTHDSLIFDQANDEKTYDENGQLHHVRLVDPTTIAYLCSRSTGQRLRSGNIYGQVIAGKVVRKYDTRTMGMFIRNKTTDISHRGYGKPELETVLREVFAQENAEKFNDRFFSNGGTVRGILDINGNISRQELESFKRMWYNTLAGIQAAGSIPIVTADDIKFVDLTPQAKDMQFEKWTNYLVNVCCAAWCIDPSEIGMANRGGASGSKANSLNEGNSKQKIDLSKDKGLKPLLTLIANYITKDIISRLAGGNYVFQFVGGDLDSQEKQLQLAKEEVETSTTVNEYRVANGKPPIKGGDIILSQFYIARLGQISQKEQIEQANASKRVETLLNTLNQDNTSTLESSDNKPLPAGLTYQDMQSGLKGKPAKQSGRSNQEGVGKDGQIKNENNVNSYGEGGKNHKR